MGQWRISPLNFALYRTSGEWRISYQWEEGESPEWEYSSGDDFPEDFTHTERYVFSRTSSALELLPALADRDLVTSPRIPLHLLPGEETMLFVSSPLWVRLATGDPLRTLKELPIRKLSDSWFGPNVREGELCYETRTRAVLDLQNIVTQHRRAVSPLLIRNETEKAFTVERVKLPVRYLSLFVDGDQLLWTDELTAVRTEDSDLTQVQISSGPPKAAPHAKQLVEPRERPDPSVLIRIFSSIFRYREESGDD